MIKTLAIIGAGNMGAAFCAGLHQALPELQLSIADRSPSKLAKCTGIRTTTNPREIVEKADAVLIAVKPQAFDALAEELDGLLREKLVISIMAGKTLAVVGEKTGSTRVVRSMPNLGVQVQCGMTAWVGTKEISEEERVFIRRLLSALGSEVEVSDDESIDRFSVIVGCGPAYFFRLCATLAHEAERLGFSHKDALNMAKSTCIASAKLLEQGSMTPDEWMKAVASKGGVTEAALKHLSASDTDAVMQEAIEKSLKRGREL